MKRKKTDREPMKGGGGLPVYEGEDLERAEFLRYETIGRREGATGKITFTGTPGRKATSGYGDQMIFDVNVKGKPFAWAIRLGSGNHRRLSERFGSRPPKGSVNVEIKEYNDNLYIAIVD